MSEERICWATDEGADQKGVKTATEKEVELLEVLCLFLPFAMDTDNFTDVAVAAWSTPSVHPLKMGQCECCGTESSVKRLDTAVPTF